MYEKKKKKNVQFCSMYHIVSHIREIMEIVTLYHHSAYWKGSEALWNTEMTEYPSFRSHKKCWLIPNYTYISNVGIFIFKMFLVLFALYADRFIHLT